MVSYITSLKKKKEKKGGINLTSPKTYTNSTIISPFNSKDFALEELILSFHI